MCRKGVPNLVLHLLLSALSHKTCILLIFYFTITFMDLDTDNCYNSLTKGTEYDGYTNVTEKGHTCMQWTENDKFKHMKYDSNFCRNPDNSKKPWCYTSSNTSFEFCDIPICGK